MFETSPRLEIYLERIKQNAQSVAKLCHENGIQLAMVSKVLRGNPEVARVFLEAGADMIADSRVPNLRLVGEHHPGVQRLLLRMPAQKQADDVVMFTEYSLNSSLQTLKALSEAAVRLGKVHKPIIMVDVGDLREGVWPDDLVDLVKEAALLPGLDLVGLGANLACYGGVMPSVENMQTLIDVRDEARRVTGLELGLLSGGNSSGLPLLASGKMPKEINHFRVGEAIVLGRNVLDRSPWQGTRQDTLQLVAEIIELLEKPSVPIGDTGQDAFGNEPEFEDRGIRQRAILNLGRQDVVIEGLEPVDPGIIVLGGSSDHAILDVSDAHTQLKLGDEVAFYPGYGATLAAATSEYVKKVTIA